MTKEQKARIDRKCREIKDEYVKGCNKRIFEEQSSVVSAAYMLQKIFTVVKTELESEEKDKITKTLTDNLNDYMKDCDRIIAEEYGKIGGADYMYQRLLDILYNRINYREEKVEPQKSEKNKSCDNCKWNCTKKCMPITCQMIRSDGHGLWEEKESEE